jgi:hypothetical protein
VVQFAHATLTGTNSYSLTKLLRGQLGTEAAMATPIPAGARVVLLDSATLGVLTEPVDSRALGQTLRYGPSTGAVGDAAFTTITASFAGVGLRPWSVCHIAGQRDPATGDVAFTWVRRTRFAGDAWDPDAVPLNEDFEAYDLAVLNGAGVPLRVVQFLGSPAWTYTAAEQLADFGALETSYTLAIAQRSALFGLGQTAERTVNP